MIGLLATAYLVPAALIVIFAYRMFLPRSASRRLVVAVAIAWPLLVAVIIFGHRPHR